MTLYRSDHSTEWKTRERQVMLQTHLENAVLVQKDQNYRTERPILREVFPPTLLRHSVSPCQPCDYKAPSPG